MKKKSPTHSSLEDLERSFLQLDSRFLNFDESSSPSYPIKNELLNDHIDYEIKDLYADGGVKNIFRAFHSKTGRIVAMAKLRDQFSDSEEQQERFLREARVTAYLSHPNIIPVYAIGFHEEKPFFSMKLIRGDSFSTILKELAKDNTVYREKYGLNERLDIFLKICEAVAYAHSRGVIHLDIKPDNIRVNRFGEVLLCDWGLARIIKSPVTESCHEEALLLDADLHNEITLTGILKGTPGYMAPEQIDSRLGEKCEQTDIYSLGCLLYTILTEQRPLMQYEDLEDVLLRTKTGEIPNPSKISPQKKIPLGLEAICLKAMKRRPSNRYQSVENLSSDLRSYLQGFATSAEESGLMKESILFIKRHKTITFFLTFIISLSSTFTFNLYKKEKLATRNEKIALENAARAHQNLQLYEQEKEVAEYFNQAGIDSILLSLSHNFRQNSARKNHKLADYIIKKNPNNTWAMSLKGNALFVLQRYDEAESFLAKGKGYPDVLASCRKMLEGQNVFDMLKDLQVSGHYSLAAQFVEHAFSQKISLEEKISWLNKHFFICNPKTPKGSYEFSYTEGEDSTLVIFGDGQTRVNNLSFVAHLPIKHLVLKDLKFFSFYEYDYSKVESITFINCQRYNFWRLDGLRYLKEITFINSKEVDVEKLNLKDVSIRRQ